MLVELLVALACTGLIVAAVLGLVVDSARTFAGRRDRLDSEARVRAATRAAQETLAAAGAGLEGTRAIEMAGAWIPIVEIADGGLRAVLPRGTAVEVDAEPGGWLGAADVSGFEPDDLVVGLGVGASAGPPVALPAGTVATVLEDDPPAGRIRIAWAPAEATLLEAAGEPRALLPVAVRELGLRSYEGALQLRRRDLGGRWQPVVDGLAGLLVRAAPSTGTSPPAGALLEVVASAAPPEADAVVATVRVRIR